MPKQIDLSHSVVDENKGVMYVQPPHTHTLSDISDLPGIDIQPPPEETTAIDHIAAVTAVIFALLLCGLFGSAISWAIVWLWTNLPTS